MRADDRFGAVALMVWLAASCLLALTLSATAARANPWEALNYAKQKLDSDLKLFDAAMWSGPAMGLSTVTAAALGGQPEGQVRFVFTTSSSRSDQLRAWLDPTKTPTGLLFGVPTGDAFLLAERWNYSDVRKWQRDESFDWKDENARVLRELEKGGTFVTGGRTHLSDGLWTTQAELDHLKTKYGPGNAEIDQSQLSSLQQGLSSIVSNADSWAIKPGESFVAKDGSAASVFTFSLAWSYKDGSLDISNVKVRGQFAPEEKAQVIGTIFETVTDSMQFATTP